MEDLLHSIKTGAPLPSEIAAEERARAREVEKSLRNTSASKPKTTTAKSKKKGTFKGWLFKTTLKTAAVGAVVGYGYGAIQTQDPQDIAGVYSASYNDLKAAWGSETAQDIRTSIADAATSVFAKDEAEVPQDTTPVTIGQDNNADAPASADTTTDIAETQTDLPPLDTTDEVTTSTSLPPLEGTTDADNSTSGEVDEAMTTSIENGGEQDPFARPAASRNSPAL